MHAWTDQTYMEGLPSRKEDVAFRVRSRHSGLSRFVYTGITLLYQAPVSSI